MEARNEFNFGPASSTLSLLCAYIPEVPTDIIASFEVDSLKIEWQLPTENGSPII